MIARAAGIGGMLALASLPLHVILDRPASEQVAAIMLAAIGAIYIGFALQDGRLRTVQIEASVGVLFLCCAVIGATIQPWAIPAAYAAHGIWDGAHHRHIDTDMPRWYIPFCAVYDWVFAIGIAAIWLT